VNDKEGKGVREGREIKIKEEGLIRLVELGRNGRKQG